MATEVLLFPGKVEDKERSVRPSWYRRTLLLLAATLVIGVLRAQPQPNVQPQPQPNFSNCGYSRSCGNIFDTGAATYQCTRYAWGRAFEKTGVAIQFSAGSHDAGQWINRLIGLHVGGSPRPNSIAVWSGGANGHVAFVEDVDNGNVKISEANWTSYPNLRYDGYRTLTNQQMVARPGNFTTYHLLGYIYLTEWEGYVDGASCDFIRGWGANRSWPSSSVYVELYEGANNYLGTMLANAIRTDVGGYLHDNGFHGFMYPLPSWVIKDGRQHFVWAKFSTGINNDLINSMLVGPCTTGVQKAGLQLSFSTSQPLRPVRTPSCATMYQITFSGRETNGVGLNLARLSMSEGWSYQLPTLGIPSRLNGFAAFQTNLTWCRGPGNSTWTITGTDDRGNNVVSSATIMFSLQ